MVASESPAGARRRLRLVLRGLREQNELTQKQVGDHLHWSTSKVNRFENGDVTISVTDLQALLGLYKMADGEEKDALYLAAKRARTRGGWWHEPRFREHVTAAGQALAQFELEALSIRSFNPTVIDGLIQTPQYASAILDFVGAELPDETKKVRVEARLKRQADVLGRRDAPSLHVLLDESVLYREVGGAETLLGQLTRLLEVIDEDRVKARIVLMTAGSLTPFLGGFKLFDLAYQENALLYRELFMDDILIEDESVILRYRFRFEEGWSVALDEPASRRLVDARRAELASNLDRRPEDPGRMHGK